MAQKKIHLTLHVDASSRDYKAKGNELVNLLNRGWVLINAVPSHKGVQYILCSMVEIPDEDKA